ncbi:MAG TPA: hypothetical protein VGH90_06870, partial [Chthoniobacteraceae bacterium]
MNSPFLPRVRFGAFQRAISAWFVLLVASTAQSQLTVPTGTNLFGDEIAHDLRRIAAGQAATNENSRAAGSEQVLVFQNRRQLRGRIVALDKEGVIWSRPDASEPLRFPLATLRRIVLGPRPKAFERQDIADNAPPPPIRATVQLPGADWLFGDLVSNGAESFNLKISEQTTFAIPRTQIESIYFDRWPAPQTVLAGDLGVLAGWSGPALNGSGKVDPGGFVVERGPLGCAVREPSKFEIEFTVPNGGERGLRVSLQPTEIEVGAFTSGTVELTFDQDAISSRIFAGGFHERKEALSEAGKDGRGPVTYQLFFDCPNKRLVVQRNGHRAADLKLWPDPTKKLDVAPNKEFTLQPKWIYFYRGFYRASEGALRFERVRIAPWAGALPEEGDPADAADSLRIADEPPLRGSFEGL